MSFVSGAIAITVFVLTLLAGDVRLGHLLLVFSVSAAVCAASRACIPDEVLSTYLYLHI